MNQGTDFDACFTDLFQKNLIIELSYMVFKYFVLISNDNTMNPTFSPVPTRLDICKFTCYFVKCKYKTL